MLVRIGLLLVVTGVALMMMGWVEPAGPLVMLAGAACAAVALEAHLDRAPAQPAAALQHRRGLGLGGPDEPASQRVA